MSSLSACGPLAGWWPRAARRVRDGVETSGELNIRSVARNPTYHYDPDYGFKDVRSKQSFTVAPGPNNPVGVVWIGLPGEGYGIHGTADPRKVGKTESTDASG